MVLFRDPLLAEVIEKKAPYIIREGAADLGKRSLEGSRSASALYVHAMLLLLGNNGIGWLIEEGIRKANLFSEILASRPEFELLIPAQTNIVLYRSIPNHCKMSLQSDHSPILKRSKSTFGIKNCKHSKEMQAEHLFPARRFLE